MATIVLASIGDHGALNVSLPTGLQPAWIDRDLSWLDFNERVLAQSLDERTPLLEGKVPGHLHFEPRRIFHEARSGPSRWNHGRPAVLLRSPREDHQLATAPGRMLPACHCSGLAEHGVFLRRGASSLHQQEEASKYFQSEVSPALTPLAIDPVHPFPFSPTCPLAVFRLRDVARDESMFARVKVPGTLKQWVSLEADLKPGQKSGSAIRGHPRQSAQPLHRHGDHQHHPGAAHARRRGGNGRRPRGGLSRTGEGTDSAAPL